VTIGGWIVQACLIVSQIVEGSGSGVLIDIALGIVGGSSKARDVGMAVG
jgi:uncharacterized membrane protein YeaQ/YmgE (transglycosylase-associated protein family)